MNSFLVIQTASIGDVILATSVLEKLHKHYPDARIDMLIKKGNEGLFSGHPFLNEVIIWDKSKKKYYNILRILYGIKHNHYDAIINIQRFAITGLLTVLSGAKYKTGFDKNPFSLFFNKRIKHTIKKLNKHEIERNHQLIADLTDEKPAAVKLYLSQNEYSRISQYTTRDYLCIAPASIWFTKQYPVEKWIEFVAEIDPDLYIYFLGSEQDYDICKEIINRSKHPNCLNLTGKLTLLETTALMKKAGMNFVNDSAPLHFASAVNAPVTVIYCSTIPAFGFGPLSDNSVVVETDEDLKCRPCGLHGFRECPEGHYKCAYTIPKEKLLSRI
ncbi:MAG: glycosyltransferase family 9 protein [Bacteroidetes bacterium]|nr:glycosyltransferase family 9 protein [Bacteroidota bacterium]